MTGIKEIKPISTATRKEFYVLGIYDEWYIYDGYLKNGKWELSNDMAMVTTVIGTYDTLKEMYNAAKVHANKK
jgi:hypothetical protein